MKPTASTALVRLKFAISGAFILGILFSTKLWLSERLYPLTPVFHFFRPFPYPFDKIILAILCALLVWVAISRRSIVICLAVTLCSALFLQDQSRLWPSFYEYAILLLLLGTYFNDPTEQRAERIFTLCQFVIALIYVWSGVSKLNSNFVTGVFPLLVAPLHLPLYPLVPHFSGWAAAAAEVIFGVCLFIPRFKKMALYDLLIMHGVLFFLIGPFGARWNGGAWTWNLASAIFLYILFSGTSEFSFKKSFQSFSIITLVVVLLIGMLPAFNLVNLWDSALSFNVYSGNTDEATITMEETAYAHLNPQIQHASYQQNDGRYSLNLNTWNLREFNAGAYPELRIFKNVFKTLCLKTRQNASLRLKITKKTRLFERQHTKEGFSCDSAL